MGWYGLDSSGSGQGPVASSFEQDNEPLGSIKCLEFLKQLSDQHFSMTQLHGVS
jgi:hypothetical protein